MVRILQDGKPEPQLGRKRAGCGQRVDTDGDDPSPEAPDLCKIMLQLDEPPLARASAGALVEVDDGF